MEHFCDIVDALEEQGIEKHMDVSLNDYSTVTIEPEILVYVIPHQIWQKNYDFN